jgi:hypothetical protein
MRKSQRYTLMAEDAAESGERKRPLARRATKVDPITALRVE